MVWFYFLLCAALLTYFSGKLCREGLGLSDKTGLSAGLIGALFLAIATSFPEISTAVFSVALLGKVSLGYGDVMGSILVNFMILIGVDYFSGEKRIFPALSRSNKGGGIFLSLSIALLFLAALLRAKGVKVLTVGVLGVENIFVILFYILALRFSSCEGANTDSIDTRYKDDGKWDIWSRFIGLLVVVMFLGGVLAKIGEQIAQGTALSETFIGMLFLGFVTSFPEIIVTFSAVKAGSIDMAVGNIVGSNLFDICIIPVLDIFVGKPILGMLTFAEIFSAGVALAVAFIFVAASFIRKDTNDRINIDTALIFVVGLVGFVLIYFLS